MFSKMSKPMRVGGDAVHVGVSRNKNLYTDEELFKFAPSLMGRPIYLEHISTANAVGEVSKSWYDGPSQCVKYEGLIWDQGTADQLKLGLIKNVSICADYEACDLEEVKIPHDLSADHLGLVAVPGVPGANINILEHLLHEGHITESAKHRIIVASVRIVESTDDIKREEIVTQLPRVTPTPTPEPPKQAKVDDVIEGTPIPTRERYNIAKHRTKTPAQRRLDYLKTLRENVSRGK